MITKNKFGKFVSQVRTKKICLFCSKEFFVTDYYLNSKFCSKKCYHNSTIGKKTWNTNTIGIMKPNKTSFKSGSFIPHGNINCQCPRCAPFLWKEINIGRKPSDATRKKLSDIKKGITPENILRGDFVGSKNYNWVGGKSYEKYGKEFNKILKELIRERDGRKCFLCNKIEGNIRLCIHHIDYNKKNNDPKNLISLCVKCHVATNKNREYWTKYFKSNIIK
jgi:hypothetical protein